MKTTMKRIITLAIAVLILAGCGGQERKGNRDTVKTTAKNTIKNPNTANGYDESMKMPKITFENDMHDFGTIMAGETISYSFKFTNTGDDDLVISDCDASCGCTVANYPRERIAPGESGFITVTFRSAGMSGMQMKTVTVASNAQPALKKLTIKATVR